MRLLHLHAFAVLSPLPRPSPAPPPGPSPPTRTPHTVLLANTSNACPALQLMLLVCMGVIVLSLLAQVACR